MKNLKIYCIWLTMLMGIIPDNLFNSTYTNGVLKLFYGTNLNHEFRIENEILTSVVPIAAARSIKLIKIPAENQLNGNTYNGGWQAEGSLVSSIATLKFSDTHYSEVSLNYLILIYLTN